MTYDRPWKSFSEQLTLLKTRGMSVTDDKAAINYLERVGYYRLSGYWYPFRQFTIHQDPQTKALQTNVSDQFHLNTHFSDAVELYLFDKKLRLLVLDALERVEVALRVDIAHLLGKRSAFAYLDQKQFHPKFSNKKFYGVPAFEAWQRKYLGLVNRSKKKEEFVKHYLRTHGENLPIWVAIEVWDFGAMSQLFTMMKVPDQEKVAAKYGINDFKVFASWLRSLNHLRNIAAHHSRLWNRNIIDQPKLPELGEIRWCDDFIGKSDLIAKPFLLFAILRHIVRVVCPNTLWHHRLAVLLENFPTIQSDNKRTISDIGVVEGWGAWWTDVDENGQ
ncbi:MULTISPECIES: Abi family protein [Marinomonas]|uniref:Abi family protein n=1 Tax=Marinomonas arctica TaxID=383750 RepID=A0A7H1J7M4_9GAMM|nr:MULTISPECIES: Abi family protein [Marinomonas]MCS7487479.1 abortive phage resistance protein [Marinomonas sp. BSi20414]QNT06490.1 Abi family protein [Marinomonas arctica]GGN35554.1 abi family protein [Marinomonas arctica]